MLSHSDSTHYPNKTSNPKNLVAFVLSRRPTLMPPIIFRLMMVMMVVMPFFVQTWTRIANHQLTAIPFSTSMMSSLVSHRLVHCFFPPQGRFGPRLFSCWLVQILPRLAVVSVQSAPAFRARWVIWSYGITVGGCTVSVMCGTSISAET